MDGSGGDDPSKNDGEGRDTDRDSKPSLTMSQQEEQLFHNSSQSPDYPDYSSPPFSKSRDESCLRKQKGFLDSSSVETGKSYESSGVEKSLESSREGEELERSVLDRGYAWVIVFGGLLTQILICGLMRLDGVFYPQFLTQFKESHQLTSWPGAMSFFIQCFVAPVASWFCNRYSVRTSVILGTTLLISGMVITAFAPSIYYLFLSYSVLQGIGRGLVMAPGIYIINMYFDKHRGIALGLASTGTGIGTLALGPLFGHLFIWLGYRNAFLVIAAICSLGWVAAALFRPLSMHKEIIRERRLKEKLKEYKRKEKAAAVARLSRYGTIDPARALGDGKKFSKGILTMRTDADSPKEEDATNGWMSDAAVVKVKLNNIKKRRRRTSSFQVFVETVFPVEGEGLAGGRIQRTKRRPLFHWALFRDFPFLVLCTSMAFFNLAQKTVFSFLEVMSEEQGVTKVQANLVLAMSGVGDILGRVIAGLLMDLKVMKPFREAFYSLILILAAGSALMVPFSYTLALLCLASALYGGTVGASVSQKSTVLASLMGKEMVNSAFGIQYSFQGLGTLAGAPIAGALKDAFHTYKLAFYLSSASMVSAALLVALSTLLFRLRKRRLAKAQSLEYKRLPAEETPAVTMDTSTVTEKDEHAPLRACDDSSFR